MIVSGAASSRIRLTTRARGVAVIVWLPALAVGLARHIDVVAPTERLSVYIGCLVISVLCGGLLLRGGPIGLLDCYALGILVFAAIAPALGVQDGWYESLALVNTALSLVLAHIAIVAAIASRPDTRFRVLASRAVVRSLLEVNVGRLFVLGLVLAFASLPLRDFEFLGALPESVAVLAVLMMGYASLFTLRARSVLSWAVLRIPLSFVAASVYLTVFFSGFGRLAVAAIGVALLAGASWLWPSYVWRLVVLGLIVPGLLIGSRIGVDRVDPVYRESLRQSEASSSLQGIGSVVFPIQRLGEMTDVRGLSVRVDGPQPLGASFMVAALAWVPSAWWPDKPPGFGRALVEILGIKGVGEEHSEAALVVGELVYAGGLLGLVLGSVAVGLVLRLASGTRSLVSGGSVSPVRALVTLMVAGGMLDLVWGGSFLFASRMGMRVLILVGLFAVARLLFTGPTRLQFRSA